jgi:hypothetical protein
MGNSFEIMRTRVAWQLSNGDPIPGVLRALMMQCQIPLYVGVSGATLEGCGAGTTRAAESEDLRAMRRECLVDLQVRCVLGVTAAGDVACRERQKQVLSSYNVH